MSRRNVTRTDTVKTTQTISAHPNVEFDRFQTLAKKLLGVSKAELDQQRDEEKRNS